MEWDTEALQYQNYLKQTELLDKDTKNDLTMAIDEIFSLYSQFEKVNLATSNYYIPLTILKCGCNLKNLDYSALLWETQPYH